MKVNTITQAYNNILEVIDFVVGRTSESLAEILTKALPLVAPVPNAVSIFYVSQTALQYNVVQALAVAASVECMFFALTEVVLKSWDLWRNNRKTVVPLAISVSAFIVYFILVMTLVYMLEVTSGHSLAPMAFPVVSVVAAVALGVTRWHKRTEQAETVGATVETLLHEKQTMLAAHGKQVATFEKQVATLGATIAQLEEQLNKQKPDATQRRETLLERLRNGGELVVKQLADEFGVSQTVIRRDLAQIDSSKMQFATGD